MARQSLRVNLLLLALHLPHFFEGAKGTKNMLTQYPHTIKPAIRAGFNYLSREFSVLIGSRATIRGEVE
jgi:hypothetical protein